MSECICCEWVVDADDEKHAEHCPVYLRWRIAELEAAQEGMVMVRLHQLRSWLSDASMAPYHRDQEIRRLISLHCQNKACAKTDDNGVFHDCVYPDCMPPEAE